MLEEKLNEDIVILLNKLYLSELIFCNCLIANRKIPLAL